MPQALIEAFLNIAYPPHCFACRSLLAGEMSKSLICKSCSEKIKFNLPPFCQKCGLGLRQNNTGNCPTCKDRGFYFDRAWSACIYERPIKELIHLFKYNSKLKLKKLFTSILTQFIKDYHLPLHDYDLLVPVPMHAARLRERENNHSEVLTKELGMQFKIPATCGKLSRIRNNAPQTSLKFKERIEAVKGAFRVKEAREFAKKNILIIDDVFTTGSTVSEIAYSLKENQALRVDVLTLARTAQEEKPQ